MATRILPYDITTARLIEEIVSTYAKLKAHPLSAVYAPEFKEKLEEGTQLIFSELNLTVRKVSAQSVIEYIDENLNEIVDALDNATDSKNEQLRRLRALFFGAKSPSVFKKPILGAQLAAQRTWLSPLQAPGAPEVLQKIGAQLSEQVDAADAATKERDAAAQEARDFKTIGARVKFIDGLNALRKNTYNGLDALLSTHPELTRDFPSRFFIKRSSYEASETLEEERERLTNQSEDLKEELASITVRLGQIEAQMSQQAAEEAARQALDDELAAAERHLEDLKAKRAKR
jgi:hypothetical protein